MKLRKILSVACALALSASLAATAFATPTTISDVSSTTDFEYTGSLKSVTVKLTMETSGNVYLNPYALEVDAGTVDGTGAAVKYTTGVASPVNTIKNEGESAIKVSIKPTVTVARSGVTLVADTETPSTTAKQLYIDFQIDDATVDSSGKVTEPAWANTVDLKTAAAASTATATGYTLAKPTTASGSTTVTPTYAAFRLTGAVSQSETLTWSDSDLTGVTIAFTFTPVGGAGGTQKDPVPDSVTVTADPTTVPASQVSTINLTAVIAGDNTSGSEEITWSVSGTDSSGAAIASAQLPSLSTTTGASVTATTASSNTAAGDTYTFTASITVNGSPVTGQATVTVPSGG